MADRLSTDSPKLSSTPALRRNSQNNGVNLYNNSGKKTNKTPPSLPTQIIKKKLPWNTWKDNLSDPDWKSKGKPRGNSPNKPKNHLTRKKDNKPNPQTLNSNPIPKKKYQRSTGYNYSNSPKRKNSQNWLSRHPTCSD